MKKTSKIKRKHKRKPKSRKGLWLTLAAASMSLLGALAMIPYQLGDLATIIPPDWKPAVTGIGLVSAFVLRVINPNKT